MSSKIAIVTDSTADLGALAGDDIAVVPLSVTFGSEQFQDGVDLTPDQFYSKLSKNPNHPITAQPPPGLFAQTYERLLAAGAEHVLSLHLSSALSGTYNSAVIAATQVDPARITVVDTRWVASGLGLLVLNARDRASRGESLEQILAAVHSDIENLHLYAAIPTLTFLARGGRIGQMQGLLGNVLKIVPIITLANGLVAEHSKVRTFARAVDKVVDLTVAAAPKKGSARCAIMHTVAPELAESVAQRVRERVDPVFLIICNAGPTVGTHAGPGAVGVFFTP
ncbi:MAG TPA: DegV family protein [Candidatus Tumulicola sp.]|nr:DegV family protein [Candidatus Tumulicola sp.]